ncbi:MAG: tRNA (adenosine(37)-N6)-threonylcarbamoyltransferase complex ATPase subunit type 1 TsaE [Campylobacter sp.]|nr:tRNA (adenosine(37)-N6)-threonylcarbamoyltransferase complex ATPase subunit type 1 TsaE [Campylobacter sp.]
MSKKYELILSESEIASVVKLLPDEGVILLRGNLASGKTTLVKEIVKSREISANVTSPTFSIMQNYGQIYHYDLYQTSIDEILQNGLFENFFEDGLHLVEWGNDDLKARLENLGLECNTINITNLNNKRKYEVELA